MKNLITIFCFARRFSYFRMIPQKVRRYLSSTSSALPRKSNTGSTQTCSDFAEGDVLSIHCVTSNITSSSHCSDCIFNGLGCFIFVVVICPRRDIHVNHNTSWPVGEKDQSGKQLLHVNILLVPQKL